jgi:hypothetical protein
MPQCGGGGGLPTYIAFIYSIDQSLLISFFYSIDQKKVFDELYLSVAAAEVSMHVRWWWREEEADVAAVVEETGPSSIDGGGGDQRSKEWWGLKEFWDEKQNNMGQTTIYRF